MTYRYDRSKKAALDKPPVFNKFSVTLTLASLEKLVSKYYKIVPGSLVIRPGVEGGASGGRGELYINFEVQSVEHREHVETGSIILKLENDRDSVRVMAFVNIDG